MLSRRKLLLSAGGLAATGAAGLAIAGPRRVFHELGLLESPDHRVPKSGWPVVEYELFSEAMGRTVSWAMAVPPTPVRGAVICLHGRNGDRRDAFDSIHLHDVVAASEHSLAVVAVDGGAHSYWHPRRDGTDALALVIDELLPEVDRTLGLSPPRAVIGWSMGGYGALLVAERAPDQFVAAVAASPALWQSFDESSNGAFDDAADFESHDVYAGVAALKALDVRVDCHGGLISGTYLLTVSLVADEWSSNGE